MLAYFQNLYELFVDMSFYIMLGLFMVGLLNTFVNKKWITAQIGSNSFWSVIKASLIGVPLPLCSCGVVPTAIELKKSGGSNGSVISFLISTPQTGVDSIIATWGMLGPFMAIFRACAAFLSGIFGGTMVNIFGKDEDIKVDAPSSCGCGCETEKSTETSCCCSSTEPAKETCSCGCESEKAAETSCSCSSTEPVKETCGCGCETEKSAETSCSCSSTEPAKETCGCGCGSEKTAETSCSCSSTEPVKETCGCGCETEKTEQTSCCCGSSEPVQESASSCCCSSETPATTMSFGAKIKRVFTYGFGSFLDEIAFHFVLGLLLSALISTIIPDDFFVGIGLDGGILSMLLMVVIGLPMYICSTSSIPIAVSLVLKGLSPGAAFVFLFTGPVTNMASLAIIVKTMGKKITALYVSSVIVASIVCGMIFDLLCEKLNYSIATGELTHVHSEEVPVYFYVIAAIFAVLLCKSFVKSLIKKIKAKRA